jgi:8-oxo-dGTP pyrophosphatase MutT (NUDIX family)
MPDRSWTLLGSRCVAQYKLVRVREDRYRFEPTRVEADFLVCESADWVLIVAITVEGQMVFVRQYRHGIGQVVIEVPGGVIDEGESPEEAAARELQEETGYRAGRVRSVGRLMPNAALNDAYCHVVLAEECRLAGKQNPDPLEAIDVVLHPVEKVPKLIRDGELVHALTIAAIARFGRVDLGGGGC